MWKDIQQDSGSYTPDIDYYWKKLEGRIAAKEQRKEKTTISLNRSKLISIAASVLVLLSISLSYYIGRNSLKPVVKPQIYTALNGKSHMTLPDGTSVWLNIGSTLTYQTSFLNKRTVQLEGEALFDVEKDPQSPFVVEVNDIAVKVLGTRFNVQAYPEKADVRVALLEGRVSVLVNNEESIMKSGEIAYFNKKNKALQIEENDVAFESFWANRTYSFEAKSLGYICKYLEKWYNITIDLDPAIADSYSYSFIVKDEPLETILQIMSRINPIQYSFEENNIVMINHVELKKRKPM